MPGSAAMPGSEAMPGTDMRGGDAMMGGGAMMAGGAMLGRDLTPAALAEKPVNELFLMVSQTCAACHTKYRAEK